MKIKKEKNQELSIWEKRDAEEEEKEVVGGGVEENKMKGRVNRETMQLSLREPNQAIMLGRLSLSNLEKKIQKRQQKNPMASLTVEGRAAYVKELKLQSGHLPPKLPQEQ